MREPQGKTAHQSLQGRFRKALEEKAQCVWSCVCVFAFGLRKRLSACGRETILVSKERGADYSFRPPTIPPRRPLLTRSGCRGIPPAAEKTCFFQEPYFYGKRGVPTRLSGCRLRSPGRPLLTMMGCRLRPPVADWCRLVPKTQLLHTRDGADRPTPFRSYIILYVNGDGGDRVRTPHCTGAPAPNGRPAYSGRKGARGVASQSCQAVFRTCLNQTGANST